MMLPRVLAGSVPTIALLVAAAFLVPPDVPLLLRQVVLGLIGVGGPAIAERLLFDRSSTRILGSLGFAVPRRRAAIVGVVASLPMWVFVPLHGWLTDVPFSLNPEWLPILLGVIVVNGVAEEVIHRGFIFRHLRESRSFWQAAAISSAVFAAQHVYLLLTIGAFAGLASVLLALALTFPLAFLYEHGGNSLGAPAILHTSSNAPMMLFVTAEAGGGLLLPHMAVVLVSMYLAFAFRPWLRREVTRSA